MKQSGIYKITCKKSIRIYIGSASNFAIRKCCHFKLLKENKHSNRKLQNAYNKYGIENFTFDILEYVEDKTKLLKREQYYFNTILFASENNRKFDILSFNFHRNAKSPIGSKRSLATKLKMRLRKRKKHSKKTKQKQRIAALNKSKSAIHIKNMSIAAKNKKKEKCKFCETICNISNLKQFHNENCLLNPNITKKSLLKRKHKLVKLNTCTLCGFITRPSLIKLWHNEKCKKQFKKVA